MEKTLILETKKVRRALRVGARTVLVLESELPTGDTPLSRHADKVAKALFAHAEREHLPVASAELARLAEQGRGYDFSPHSLCFAVLARRARARMRVQMTLCYTVKGQTHFLQSATQCWSADGEYRLR